MTKTVIGVFEDRLDAEEAIDALKYEDYDAKDISIVMRDREAREEITEDTGATDIVGGAASGATTGAILGGLAGLVASFAIPGLGAFFIGGPIAAALGLGGAAATTVSGAATGALAGGLIGALTGLGLSEDEATHYNERIQQGAILVAVPARAGDEAEVRDILDDSGATDIKTISGTTRDRDEYIEERHRERGHTRMHVGALGGKKARRHRVE